MLKPVEISNTHESQVIREVSIRHAKVRDDIFVFEHTEKTKATACNWKKDRVNEHVTGGFATEANLKKLIRGDTIKSVSLEKMVIITPEQQEFLRTEGYNGLSDLLEKERKKSSKEKKKSHLDAFLSEEWTADDLFQWEKSKLIRHDGQKLPSALRGDYIDAKLHDGCYDLEKAVEILSKRDDVKVVSERITGRSIRMIPWYNSEPGRDQCIEIVFSPTLEQYNDIENNAPGLDKWRYIFDNDMLGLRAGGAALFDNYDDEREADTDHESPGY